MYREKGNQISLVILDLIMPVMDGKRCLAEIMRMNPEANVIIATGYSEHGPVPKGELRDAKGFVEKPYSSNSLLRMVREVICLTGLNDETTFLLIYFSDKYRAAGLSIRLVMMNPTIMAVTTNTRI